MKTRALIGGLEGVGGGLMGTDVFRAMARALKGGASAPAGPPSGLGGTPVATNALSTPSTAGAASSAGTLPGSGRNALAGPETPQRQLPSPEAVPSQPQTYKGTPLPPGVALDVKGVPYRKRTGHKVRRDIFEE